MSRPKKTAEPTPEVERPAEKPLASVAISYPEWLTLRQHKGILPSFEGKDKSFIPVLVRKGLLTPNDHKLTPAGAAAITGFFK